MGILIGFILLFVVATSQAQPAWRELPPMPTPRYAAAAATLHGRIYVIGGIGLDGKPLTTVEAYDPALQAWIREVPQLEEPVAFAAAVTLEDNLYLIGGMDENGETTDEVWMLDWTQRWQRVASLQQERQELAAIAFGSQIYAIGGRSLAEGPSSIGRQVQPRSLASIERYDPQKDAWEVLPFPIQLVQPVHLAAATTWEDKIYIIGGLSNNLPIGIIQQFRPLTGEVVLDQTLLLPYEWWAGAALTYRNAILLLGGLSGKETGLTAVQALRWTDNGWQLESLPPLRQARFSFAAVLHNDTIFVFGGLEQRDGKPLNNAEATSAAVLTNRQTETLPPDFWLQPPYPHPFQEQVTFTFSLSSQQADKPVTLTVYDLLGRPVAHLLQGAVAPGSHVLVWDGRTMLGSSLPAGVYIVRLVQGAFHQERLLIRAP
ncbi:Kelch repeat-containing protein [Rhodothermus bifroesti]|uniref:Kelch repeat-containing protein n=1 Tax=Rhodothermus bifroesti TaxID=2823335 RepID=UPI001AEFFC50|nr:FlgD immunoglobulin-like domain containing protein [Rhodothermus bifroesti]